MYSDFDPMNDPPMNKRSNSANKFILSVLHISVAIFVAFTIYLLAVNNATYTHSALSYGAFFAYRHNGTNDVTGCQNMWDCNDVLYRLSTERNTTVKLVVLNQKYLDEYKYNCPDVLHTIKVQVPIFCLALVILRIALCVFLVLDVQWGRLLIPCGMIILHLFSVALSLYYSNYNLGVDNYIQCNWVNVIIKTLIVFVVLAEDTYFMNKIWNE
jgi:hypothetical protein